MTTASLWNAARARNFVKEFCPEARGRRTFAANMALLGSMVGAESASHINPIFFCYLLDRRVERRLLGDIIYREVLAHSCAWTEITLAELLDAQDGAVGREAKIAAAIRVFEKTEELLVYKPSPRLLASTMSCIARLSAEEPMAFRGVAERFLHFATGTIH